jgi:DNA modification methylase
VKAQMCVTSPPYFGLRDYGHPGQIGLEPTPEAYIAAMVEVFRCVRDVLADDGTLWLNIGDSYASNYGMGANRASGWWSTKSGQLEGKGWGQVSTSIPPNSFRKSRPDGLKVKDLIGIPWMLAFALRADGWYLRQDIIWHKPNAPGEANNPGRFTKSHEHVFLLSKQQNYLFDDGAVREQGATTERKMRDVWMVPTSRYKGLHSATFPPALIEPCILAGSRPADTVLDPFMGSGTTAQVAQQLGRQYIGCELNPQYLSLRHERTAQQALMLEEA